MYPRTQFVGLRFFAILRTCEEKGITVIRMRRMGRKFHYCENALLGLMCCAAGAMALLRAGNGACANAQSALPATAPASQTAPPAASSQDVVGTWQETLHIPKADQHLQIDLRLVVKISKTDAGALDAVWYSIDQGPQSLPMATIRFRMVC